MMHFFHCIDYNIHGSSCWVRPSDGVLANRRSIIFLELLNLCFRQSPGNSNRSTISKLPFISGLQVKQVFPHCLLDMLCTCSSPCCGHVPLHCVKALLFPSLTIHLFLRLWHCTDLLHKTTAPSDSMVVSYQQSWCHTLYFWLLLKGHNSLKLHQCLLTWQKPLQLMR